MVRIRDTAHVEEIPVCEALLADAGRPAQIEVVAWPQPLQFDADGSLPDVGSRRS
jgi:hypothetical protein